MKKILSFFLSLQLIFGNFLMANQTIALSSHLDGVGQVGYVVNKQIEGTTIDGAVLLLKNLDFLRVKPIVKKGSFSEKINNLDPSLGFTEDFFTKDFKIKKGIKSIVLENIGAFDETQLNALIVKKDWLALYQLFITVLGDKLLDANMEIRGGRVKTIREIIQEELAFGTSGWRDQVGLGFNPLLIAIVFDAMSDYYIALANTDKYFLLGFDTRDFGPEAAEIARRIFNSKGIKVIIPQDAEQHTSTPQIAFLVHERIITIKGIDYVIGAGAYITASHNPKEDNGIKGFSPSGNAAPSEMTDRIGATAKAFERKIAAKRGFTLKDLNTSITYQDSDIYDPYLDSLLEKYDRPTLRKMIKTGKVFFDCSNGSSREATKAALQRLGLRNVDQYILNQGHSIPRGYHPNPDRAHSGVALLKSAGMRLNVATKAQAQLSVKTLKRNFQEETRLMKKFVGNEEITVEGIPVAASHRLQEFEDYTFTMFAEIEKALQARTSQPTNVSVRNFDAQGKVVGVSRNETGRPAKIAVFAMAANPVHGGHIEPALKALYDIIVSGQKDRIGVDKVIFVIAAEDPRKPDLLKEDVRYPMFKYLVERYPDMFEFSGVAKGTNYDGETNIFRLMEINPDMKAEWFYMVGSDHALVYTEQVVGTVVSESADEITVLVQSGETFDKKTKKMVPVAPKNITYKKNVPEFYIKRNENGTVLVRKLDTIGKLNDRFENGVAVKGIGDDHTAVKGKNHTMKAVFIGRDKAELARNLAISKAQIESNEIDTPVEIVNIEQDFAFSSTEIREAFQGNLSIGYLWALGLPTLAYLASLVEIQKAQGVPKQERLYSISDDVLAKMVALRDEAARQGLLSVPFVDLSLFKEEELEILMEQGGEVHGVRFVAEGSKTVKADAIAVFDKLVRGEAVNIWLYGKKHFVMAKTQDITVIKMDADADRIASQTGGKYLDANAIGALLTDYHLGVLYEKLKKGESLLEYARFIKGEVFTIKVGRTVASTEMIDAIMDYWQKEFDKLHADFTFKFVVDEMPVGFKNFAKNEAEYLVWFESSSHIADWKTGCFVKDDGLAIGLRILEMQNYYRGNLVDVIERLKTKVAYKKEFIELAVDYGASSAYEETRTRLKSNRPQMVENLTAFLEAQGSSLEIKEVIEKDGLKVIFTDGSSLLVRVSGTERKGRIFAQAPANKMAIIISLGYYLLGQDNELVSLLKSSKDVLLLKILEALLEKMDMKNFDVINVTKIARAA